MRTKIAIKTCQTRGTILTSCEERRRRSANGQRREAGRFQDLERRKAARYDAEARAVLAENRQSEAAHFFAIRTSSISSISYSICTWHTIRSSLTLFKAKGQRTIEKDCHERQRSSKRKHAPAGRPSRPNHRHLLYRSDGPSDVLFPRLLEQEKGQKHDKGKKTKKAKRLTVCGRHNIELGDGHSPVEVYGTIVTV